MLRAAPSPKALGTGAAPAGLALTANLRFSDCREAEHDRPTALFKFRPRPSWARSRPAPERLRRRPPAHPRDGGHRQRRDHAPAPQALSLTCGAARRLNSITEGKGRRPAARGARRRPQARGYSGCNRASFATPCRAAVVERRSYPLQTGEDRRSTHGPARGCCERRSTCAGTPRRAPPTRTGRQAPRRPPPSFPLDAAVSAAKRRKRRRSPRSARRRRRPGEPPEAVECARHRRHVPGGCPGRTPRRASMGPWSTRRPASPLT